MIRKRLSMLFVVGALALSAMPAGADAPRRVVSINLCTDILALQLAAPGQLVSVSYLAQDPASSVMAELAKAIPANHASPEEVFALRPDLVLAGAFTPPDTLRLIGRLGVPVEILPSATSLQDIRENLQRMGRAMGREPEAARILARFDAGLAELRAEDGPQPRALIYAPNGYVPGTDSLAGTILAAAGYRNVAGEYGIAQGGTLPLEQVLLSDPDLLVLSGKGPGHARAEDMLDHPALRDLAARRQTHVVEDRSWACGTSHVLGAIRTLRALRHDPETRP